MDVNLAWTIAAFFIGAMSNRRDAKRQHATEVHATREQAFEVMQRETWLALQDALVEYFEASKHSAVARLMYRRRSELRHPTPIDTTEIKTTSSTSSRARLKALTLHSRLADEPARRAVLHATNEIAIYELEEWPDCVEDELARSRMLDGAVDQAIETLGELISQPPERPTQPRRWWPRRARPAAGPFARTETSGG